MLTAYAEHLALTKPDRLSRHRAYVRALTATGVQVYLGHFKPKQVWIESLGRFKRIWQEKATDVNVVSQVFVHAARDAFDVGVIVSGDAVGEFEQGDANRARQGRRLMQRTLANREAGMPRATWPGLSRPW